MPEINLGEDIETSNEEIDMEIQLIQSIFEEKCKIFKDEKYVRYEMTITPQTAGDTKLQYSLFDMQLKCSIADYPQNSEIVSLVLRSAGLTDQTRSQLLSELSQIATEGLENQEGVVFQIFDHCSEFITEHNIPETECSICLDLLDEAILRTDCYHFFHRECLEDYIKSERQHKLSLQQENNANAKIDFCSYLCPDCREEIFPMISTWQEENRFKNFQQMDAGDASAAPELETQVSLDTETEEFIRQSQARMAKILEKQKEKGGIIVEENKVLRISDMVEQQRLREQEAAEAAAAEIQALELAAAEEPELSSESPEKSDKFTNFQKLSDSDISIIKNLHFYNTENPPNFDTNPKNWTRQTWSFCYKQFCLAKNQSNQRKNKLKSSDLQKIFKSKFSAHIPNETFGQVIFLNSDLKKLKNFLKKPNKNTKNELMKPVEYWSAAEHRKINNIFGEFDAEKSLNSGKLVQKSGDLLASGSATGSTSSSSKSKNQASSSKNLPLTDKDIRVLQNLKHMHSSNEIQWGKLYFKNDPKFWDDFSWVRCNDILDNKELYR